MTRAPGSGRRIVGENRLSIRVLWNYSEWIPLGIVRLFPRFLLCSPRKANNSVQNPFRTNSVMRALGNRSCHETHRWRPLESAIREKLARDTPF